MIASCPACGTRFALDDAALGINGRKVRCAKCRETWHQMPEAMNAMAVFSAPALEEQPPFPSFMSQPSPGDSMLDWSFETTPAKPAVADEKSADRNIVKLAALGTLIIVTLLLGIVLVMGRESIAARYPQLAPLYADLGLLAEPVGAGLELRGVNSALVPGKNGVSLVVAGEIANISTVPREVPPLIVSLRDVTNAVVMRWQLTPQHGKLPPGSTMPFQTTVATPPKGASSAVVSFEP